MSDGQIRNARMTGSQSYVFPHGIFSLAPFLVEISSGNQKLIQWWIQPGEIWAIDIKWLPVQPAAATGPHDARD